MYRLYFRKYDMEEPPKLEESMDDGECRSKRSRGTKEDELEERFYK